jgi:YVTN family beta-propeller protein
VALKLLAPALAEDPAFRERFLVESRLAASLDHPNVVPIYDAGETEGQLYLAMRYVEGSDLKRLLQEEGRLAPERAIAICQQIANALDSAHARGLVHRDVKPSNVLLDEHEHAYLADFGLTRRLAEQAPGFEAGLSLGTPAYVAPEQIEGKELDGRADQYSLACLLCECLTGEPPFPRGSEAATLFAHLEEEPPAPPGLESVLPKALAKDPEDRCASCMEFVAAARRALGLEPRRARWPLAVAGIGAALIGAALLAFFLTGGDGPVEPAAKGRLVRIDPATNTVSASIATGDGPNGVAINGDDVWIVDRADGTLWRIDARTNQVVQRSSAHGTPADIAIGGDWVLVANGALEANVAAFEATTGTLDQLKNLPGGFASPQLAAGPEGIWVATGDRHVGRMRFLTSERDPLTFIPPPTDEYGDAAFSGAALGEGAVWVVGDLQEPRLWKLDPVSGRIRVTVELPSPPKDVAVGEGAVWVTSQLDDTLTRIDPKTGAISARVAVGRGAAGVVVAAGSVWVANEVDGTVSQVDPRTLRVVETIDVGGAPNEIAAGESGVWVTSRGR